jgi:hypothetical protein
MKIGFVLLALSIACGAAAWAACRRRRIPPRRAAFQTFLGEMRAAASAASAKRSTQSTRHRIHRQAIEADRSQAEFVRRASYLRPRVSRSASSATKLMADTADDPARRSGLSSAPRFVVAIIGLKAITAPTRSSSRCSTSSQRSRSTGGAARSFVHLLAALEIVDKG